MNCPRCGLELRSVLPFPKRLVYPHVCRVKTFRNPAADVIQGTIGVGPDWAQPVYGQYFARSVPVYAAITIRAENVVRPPLTVYRTLQDGSKEPVEPDHPLQVLLTKVNPFWTRGDLWRATSVNLDLWGAAYWLLKKSGPGAPPTEIWPLRPDKMRVMPDRVKYIAGFEYDTGRLRQQFRPDEVLWFRRFNPLDEFAGLSPMAPARLSVDMGVEALRHNKKVFENGMLWGNVGLTMDAGVTPWTQEQVDEFYDRLKKRFAGTDNSWKPPVLANMKPMQMGFSQREMEFVASLEWAMADVVRTFGVPEPLLNLKDITFANADAAERIFWRQTMMPLLMFLQEEINEMLVPQFGDDSLSCEFDLDTIEALQEDRDKAATRAREDVKVGILTVNEVREERGLLPVPWGDEPRPQPTIGAPATEGMPVAAAPKMFELEGPNWRLYKRDWSDHALDSISTLHLRALSRHEKRMVVFQRRLFAEQRDDLLKRLKTQRSGADLRQKDLGDLLFDPLEWAKLWRAQGAPLFTLALTQSAESQVTAFRLPVGFNPATEGVRNWLSDRVTFWATRVNEETAKLLAEEVQDGVASGEGIKDIQGRIERVFKFSSTIRAEMIARTETQAAVNRGALEAYKQSGVVESKMWLATLDDRTREHHLEAHRQIVPLEAQFEVGGEMVDGPGDGSAANVINCRCTLVPVLANTKQLAEAGEKDGPGRTHSQNRQSRNT